jgi:hypothetical protein
MFGQFPFAGAVAGAPVVPEFEVDGVVFVVLPAEAPADGVVVVVEELPSAANATAAPPPTRAPVNAITRADFWIHFMVITSSMVLRGCWFER